MEYISAEEFLKQPKEVQAVFLNWWKPKLFDLIHIDYYSVNSIDTVISEKDIKKYGIEFFPNGIDGDVFPLLTEGQLRKFIEDKLGYMDITLEDIEDGNNMKNYEIECYPYELLDGFKDSKVFNVWAVDLLQAYWKVACEIASSEVK